jgi:hypothetical protein
LSGLLAPEEDRWTWSQSNNEEYKCLMKAAVVSCIYRRIGLRLAEPHKSFGILGAEPEPESALQSNEGGVANLEQSGSGLSQTSSGAEATPSLTLSWFIQLYAIKDWTASTAIKEAIGLIMQIAAVNGQIEGIITYSYQQLSKSVLTPKQNPSGWLPDFSTQQFGEGGCTWPTDLSAEQRQNYQGREWVIFSSLLSQTAARAPSRRELAKQLAAAGGTLDTVVKEATQKQQPVLDPKLDGYVIFDWVSSIVAMDASHCLVPLFCQVRPINENRTGLAQIVGQL